MKLIQIGVGGFGRSWLDVVLTSPEWEPVGFVDVNQEALETIIRECNVPKERCFTSLDECLDKVKADALLNITPPSFHKEITLKAMERGLHVLVAKLLAENLEDAVEMVEAAGKHNVKLMADQNFRFRKYPRTIRKFIEEGRMGKISYVVLNYMEGIRWNDWREEMEYPLLIDEAIHQFDFARYMLGKDPVKIYAESWNPPWSWFKGDACAAMIVDFEDNVRMNYIGTWANVLEEGSWDGNWEIYGEKGVLFWSEGKLEFHGLQGKQNVELISTEREEERHLLLLEFYRAIKENKEPETSGKDNLKSLGIIFKALESIKKGEVINI